MSSRTNSWYFDSIQVGERFTTRRRLITREMVEQYSELSGDRHPLHSDDGIVLSGLFSQPVAHGLLGRIVLSGLVHEVGTLANATVAHLEICSWRFLKPTYFGDEVHGVTIVADKRQTSQSHLGVVTLAQELVNQDGLVVQAGEQKLLMRCRMDGEDANS